MVEMSEEEKKGCKVEEEQAIEEFKKEQERRKKDGLQAIKDQFNLKCQAVNVDAEYLKLAVERKKKQSSSKQQQSISPQPDEALPE